MSANMFWPALAAELPSNYFAGLKVVGDHPVIAFPDKNTVNYATRIYFCGQLPDTYDGGGLTVRLFWAPASSDQSLWVMNWSVSIERLANDNGQIDGYSPGGEVQHLAVPPATANTVHYSDVQLTEGIEMDSLAAGELFRLVVTRRCLWVDSMAGDALLLGVGLRESDGTVISEPPTTEPPSTEPPTSEAPTTEPVTTEPPASYTIQGDHDGYYYLNNGDNSRVINLSISLEFTDNWKLYWGIYTSSTETELWICKGGDPLDRQYNPDAVGYAILPRTGEHLVNLYPLNGSDITGSVRVIGGVGWLPWPAATFEPHW